MSLADSIVASVQPEKEMARILRDLIAALDDNSIPKRDRVAFAIEILDELNQATARIDARLN